MKAIMLSIQPRHCENICTVVGEKNGKPIYKKTIEVRKTRPKIETPFKCYIYETKGLCDTPTFIDEDGHISYRGRGTVIGEFVCDKIERIEKNHIYNAAVLCKKSCLSIKEIADYTKGETFYGLHISDLKIYDKSKELGEFTPYCKRSAKWCKTCTHAITEELPFGSLPIGCDLKPLTRPPQSWMYVEESGK